MFRIPVLLFGFLSFACVKEPKLNIEKAKIVSFYVDYYLLKENYNLLSSGNKNPTNEDITNFALKQNKLTAKELKEINEFLYLNPKIQVELITEMEKKVEILFKKKEKKVLKKHKVNKPDI